MYACKCKCLCVFKEEKGKRNKLNRVPSKVRTFTDYIHLPNGIENQMLYRSKIATGLFGLVTLNLISFLVFTFISNHCFPLFSLNFPLSSGLNIFLLFNDGGEQYVLDNFLLSVVV